jgi:hypothetical protein
MLLFAKSHQYRYAFQKASIKIAHFKKNLKYCNHTQHHVTPLFLYFLTFS